MFLLAATVTWAPVMASADPCEDSRAEEAETLREWLLASLDLKSAQFKIAQISAWRAEYDDPVLLEEEYVAALQAEAEERPVVDLAKVDYQHAQYDVGVNCPNADG